MLFFIPWDDRWIVGTTDTEWSGDRAEPAATAEDVDYILGEANRVLARPLTRADVLAVYAGLRPLVAAPPPSQARDAKGGDSGRRRSRRPSCPASTWSTCRCPGLVSIAGGKFTTYRLMARDVVDAAVEDFPRPVAAVGHRPAAAARRRRPARGPRLGAAAGRGLRRARSPRSST